MKTDMAPGAAGEWRRGWPVVLAGAAGMALSTIAVYSSGIFIAPLEAEFGWSRAQISSGLTMLPVLGVIFSPFVGIAIDRYGPRRIGIVGGAGYLACIGALALTTGSIWSWWALWLLLGVFALAIKPTVWTAGVSSLFTAGRGLALSVMLCGTGLGSSLTPIIANWLIAHHGWRAAFVGLAAFWSVLLLPVIYLLFGSAADRARKARGRGGPMAATAPVPTMLEGVSAREGLLSWRFAKLALAAFLTSLAVVSFVVNAVPILSFTGLSRDTAAAVAGLVGISTIVGRLGGGYLLDRVNGNIVAGVAVALPVIPAALLIAAPGVVPVAAVAALVLGLSLGAELDAVAYLATRHFGLRNFGVIFGTIAGLLSLSTGLGPLLVSLTYDLSGSYVPVLAAYIPLSLIASALFFSLGRYPDFAMGRH